jgi:hypothetical protein
VSEEPEQDRSDYLFGLLLEIGAVEFYGVSGDTGEPIYRITDLCEEIFPELWQAQVQHVGETANRLWQMGLVEINLSAKGETVYFREHNYRKYLEIKDSLSEEDKTFIEVFLEDLS